MLQNELMAVPIENPITVSLSRVTVGFLEDFGYKVNYEAADKFASKDLNESSLCPAKPPSTSAVVRGNTDRFKNDVTQPKLSDKGINEEATNFGRQLLLESSKKNRMSPSNTTETTLTYVGDEGVNVLYEENGRIYFVSVTL